MIITIDGPSASGKSTASRLLAQQLGYYYINTGMLFRAIAYILLYKKSFIIEQLSELSSHDFNNAIRVDDLTYHYLPEGLVQITYQQEDITQFLKSPMIDKAASVLGTSQIARNFLMHYERELARNHNVIIEGRDCGSVIFPDAPIKFFLIADSSQRARRWQQDQKQKGQDVSLQQAIQVVQERDERDTKRKLAPLIKPTDATVIDNTCLTIAQTVDAMLNVVKEKKK